MREQCPSDDEWLGFAQRHLGASRTAELEAHLFSCEPCTEAVAEAARAVAGTREGVHAPAEPDAAWQVGKTLGRYVILERLGQGAMGAVYAAYDPQLERRIAIKVLRPDRRAGASDGLQQRLLREAQAMARLRHPNVLAIHDAASLDGGVFLAMDLVASGTLRKWLSTPRTPREVLHVFSLAGAGLAAAHRAGIVHRDFKPDNVLVDEAGGVFVTDFGVARLNGEASVPGEPTASPPAITSNGAMVGTPAYMSPEQLRGEPADARSDLFGFCVALYEALYGAFPFRAADVRALRSAMEQGPAQEPPAKKGVPRSVARALLRGLRRDPAERFQSMDELLAAIRPPAAQKARVAGALALVVLGVAGLAFATHRLEQRKLERCRAGDGRLERTFDEGRQRAVQAAFDKSGAPSAGAAFASVREALLAATAAIAQGRAAACEATLGRGEASADLFDRRMQCLDDRAQDVAALVETLARADSTAVEKAVLAVQQLEAPSACADRRRLLDASPLPRDERARARIVAVREEVARMAALHRAGHYRAAIEQSVRVAELARDTGYAPLEAEALYWRGRALYDGNEQARAPEALVAAAAAAERARRDDLLAQAQSQLVVALGWAQKTDEALRQADLARGIVARLGDDPVLLAELLLARGFAHAKVYQSPQALAADEQALALLEAQAQSAPARLVQGLVAYAGVLGSAGKNREAVAADERALPLAEKLFGPLHPLTLSLRTNLGLSCANSGQRRRALPILRRALADRRTALGRDHLDVARTSGALGTVLGSLGDAAGAAAAFTEAVAIQERKLGKEHPELIANLALLAEPLGRLGRFDEAYAALDRSEALARKHQGDKSAMIGFILEARAGVLEQQGRTDEARRTFELAAARIQAAIPGHGDAANCRSAAARQLRKLGQADAALGQHRALLALAEKSAPPDPKELADRQVEVGSDLLAAHRAAEARPFFERALPALEPDESDPIEIAAVQFAAAQAFAGADRARAADLAHKAAEALAPAPATADRLRAEVRRWLAANDAVPR